MWCRSSARGAAPEVFPKPLVDEALALQREILRVAVLFERTMPYAHYDYLIAILGQIDTLSLCRGKSSGKEMVRLSNFLDEYMPLANVT